MTYALGRNVIGSLVAFAMASLLYGCGSHATQAKAEPSVGAMQPDASANDEPTSDALLDATHQTGDWILPGHGYDDNRYVESTIARGRLSGLSLAWSTRLADDGEQEAAPIVWHGTIFLSTPHNHVVALNGKTGALVWDSPYTPATILDFAANRGVGIAAGKVFIATQDCRIRALDARSGKQVWSVAGCSNAVSNWYSMPAYLYKGMLLVGTAGGDFGGNGSLQAFRISDGAKMWQWDTIPAAGQPGRATWPGDSWKHGGAALWGGLSVDPKSNTVFIAPGNPGPDFNDKNRVGKDLYADSVVALDISGTRPKLKWYYPLIQNDTHDDDPAMPAVLFSGVVDGRSRQLLGIGDKAANFVILDRATGAVVHRLAVTHQHGNDAAPTVRGLEACPNHGGGIEWLGGSYDPKTNYFIVPTTVECGLFRTYAVVPAWAPGQNYRGGPPTKRRNGTGLVDAIDVSSGRIVWERPLPYPAEGGVLITSTGLAFTSDLSGNVYALDTLTGKTLWHRSTNSAIVAPFSSYRVDGNEYLVTVGGEAGNQATPNLPASRGSFVMAFRVGASAAMQNAATGQSAATNVAAAGVVQRGLVSYTAAQVSAGKAQYTASCIACHGAQLQGVSAPALSGSAFGKLHVTIATMQNVVTKQMPLTAPGSLTKNQYASLMAFLLASNCVKAAGGGTQPFVAPDAETGKIVLAGASCPVK